jgi:outer membrane protein TolC
MKKNILLTVFVGLYSWANYAQSNTVSDILTEIEKNNLELKSYSSLMESKVLGLKSTNNLPNPEAGAYYLPFGANNTGDYTEFQITQSMEFPTVYKTRGDIIALEKEKLAIDYKVKRQSVLSDANNHLLNLVFLDNKKSIAKSRLDQAKKLNNQITSLYEKEKVGVLDLNKSKVALMQEQLNYNKFDNSIKEVLLLLKNLNGGIAISFFSTGFTDSLTISPLENIIAERESLDPTIMLLTKNEEIAQQQIKLSKNNNLPNLTAGFNYQGVSGSNYSGVYGGITIPLWNNKNKVEEAKVNFVYQQAVSLTTKGVENTLVENKYNEYTNLLLNYREYQNALANLNNSELLLKSYELGQISFLIYYSELQFYAQAQDTLLEIEYQLHQLKAELLKYKL